MEWVELLVIVVLILNSCYAWSYNVQGLWALHWLEAEIKLTLGGKFGEEAKL